MYSRRTTLPPFNNLTFKSKKDSFVKNPSSEKQQESQEESDFAFLHEKALRCRTCRQPVSTQAAIFSMRSSFAIQLLTNPAGLAREVLTVKTATHLTFEAWCTSEASWFSGYTWRIAYCARCTTHLGWRFERESAKEGPTQFFGLLCEQIESFLE